MIFTNLTMSKTQTDFSRLESHYEEKVYFVSLSSQEFLVLIWPTSEGWKTELNMMPHRGFQPRTPGMGITFTETYI